MNGRRGYPWSLDAREAIKRPTLPRALLIGQPYRQRGATQRLRYLLYLACPVKKE